MTDDGRDPADAVKRRVASLLGAELSSRWHRDQQLGWAGFMEIARVLPDEHNREMMAAHGLSLSLLSLLGHLDEREGPRTARDLAIELELSAGRVSRHLATLEGAGLVTRRHNADDGRAQDVELTDAGRARLGAARRTALEIVERDFLDHITPDDLTTLARIVTGILRAHDAKDAVTPP